MHCIYCMHVGCNGIASRTKYRLEFNFSCFTNASSCQVSCSTVSVEYATHNFLSAGEGRDHALELLDVVLQVDAVEGQITPLSVTRVLQHSTGTVRACVYVHWEGESSAFHQENCSGGKRIV